MIAMKSNEEPPMQLSEDDVACCVCYVPYNNEKQFPLKICSNRHVVCNKCLWAMFIEPGVEFSCPFCKEIIEKKSRCIIHPNNLKKLEENMAKSRVISEKSSIKEIVNKVEDLELHEKVEINPSIIFEKEEIKAVEKSPVVKPFKASESEKKVIIHSNGERKPGQLIPSVIVQRQPDKNQTIKLEQSRAHSQSYKIEVKSSVRPGTYVPASQNESMRLKKEETPGNKDAKSTSFAYEKKPYK